jgi:hypothetical protein
MFNKAIKQTLADALQKLQAAEARVVAVDRSTATIEFKPDGTIISANENLLTTMGTLTSEVMQVRATMLMLPVSPTLLATAVGLSGTEKSCSRVPSELPLMVPVPTGPVFISTIPVAGAILSPVMTQLAVPDSAQPFGIAALTASVCTDVPLTQATPMPATHATHPATCSHR